MEKTSIVTSIPAKHYNLGILYANSLRDINNRYARQSADLKSIATYRMFDHELRDVSLENETLPKSTRSTPFPSLRLFQINVPKIRT